MTTALIALEVAAQCGQEIFDILCTAGADEYSWLVGSILCTNGNHWEIPEIPSLSALSTSSVHQAIAAGNRSMLRLLLTVCNRSPNYCPRAAQTLALPFLSFAVARCDLQESCVQLCLVGLLSC